MGLTKIEWRSLGKLGIILSVRGKMMSRAQLPKRKDGVVCSLSPMVQRCVELARWVCLLWMSDMHLLARTGELGGVQEHEDLLILSVLLVSFLSHTAWDAI